MIKNYGIDIDSHHSTKRKVAVLYDASVSQTIMNPLILNSLFIKISSLKCKQINRLALAQKGKDNDKIRNQMLINDSRNNLQFHLCPVLRVSVLMKQIIDNETGEIVEVAESNELAEQKLYEVGAIDKETFEFLESFLYYQERYETFKYTLEQAMKDNGIKTWKNDYFTATVKDDSIQKRVDTERLKEDGLYDKYLKLVSVKGGLQIKFRKDK